MLDADWRDHVPTTAPWDGVLMCTPDHFDVIDEKNVFMRGQQGRVDRARAKDQWDELADTYRAHGVRVHCIEGGAGLEDMVFCANGVCVLPRPEGGADVVRSRMNHPSRAREVPLVAAWFEARGLPTRGLPEGCGPLEGHGDVLVVPGRRLLLGGHGGRSSRPALAALADLCGIPVVPLALEGSRFYHLDTCLAVLDERSLLVHPPAFTGDALATLQQLFPRIVLADEREAAEHLAVNAHALSDGHVLVPAQATRTAGRLARAGYEPLLVDVSEFHRSGGSVFCLRLDTPSLPHAPTSAER